MRESLRSFSGHHGIVNHYQKSWAHDIIAHLRAQVRKPDIEDDSELRATLAKQGYFD